MPIRKALFVALVLLLGVATWHATRASSALDAAPAVAAQDSAPVAPDFSVTSYSGGRRVSLSDLRGKVVLLYFFFPT